MAKRITQRQWRELVDAALSARKHAYAPYSRFKVGAALLGSDGKIYPGCNVENATYGATICAERTAITTAVAQGVRAFDALAVVTPANPPGAPCGICRQMLVEFCVDIPIRLANPSGEIIRTKLSTMLPSAFRWKGVKPAP